MGYKQSTFVFNLFIFPLSKANYFQCMLPKIVCIIYFDLFAFHFMLCLFARGIFYLAFPNFYRTNGTTLNLIIFTNKRF